MQTVICWTFYCGGTLCGQARISPEVSLDHQRNVDGSVPSTPDKDFTAPVYAKTSSASNNVASVSHKTAASCCCI